MKEKMAKIVCDSCKTQTEMKYTTWSNDGKSLLCQSCKLDDEYGKNAVYRSWIDEYSSDDF